MDPAADLPSDSPVSRVDLVYRRLREAIVDGEYPPGAPLRHQDLTDDFGVSLIPIREAIRKLEVERLVESIPNKGARVAPISARDVDDAYATRVAIEQQALRCAIANMSPDDIAEIKEIRQEMEASVRRDDPSFYELHRRVHFAMYEPAGSPWLLHLIEILWANTERHRRLAATLRPFVDVGHDQHGRIIDAIERGDVDQAVTALEDDLRRTRDLVIEAYQAAGEGLSPSEPVEP